MYPCLAKGTTLVLLVYKRCWRQVIYEFEGGWTRSIRPLSFTLSLSLANVLSFSLTKLSTDWCTPLFVQWTNTYRPCFTQSNADTHLAKCEYVWCVYATTNTQLLLLLHKCEKMIFHKLLFFLSFVLYFSCRTLGSHLVPLRLLNASTRHDTTSPNGRIFVAFVPIADRVFFFFFAPSFLFCCSWKITSLTLSPRREYTIRASTSSVSFACVVYTGPMIIECNLQWEISKCISTARRTSVRVISKHTVLLLPILDDFLFSINTKRLTSCTSRAIFEHNVTIKSGTTSGNGFKITKIHLLYYDYYLHHHYHHLCL